MLWCVTQIDHSVSGLKHSSSSLEGWQVRYLSPSWVLKFPNSELPSFEKTHFTYGDSMQSMTDWHTGIEVHPSP